MYNFFLRMGGLLFISKRHKSVRGGVMFLLTNVLLLASAMFFLEILLIYLGVGNIYVPMTHAISEFLSEVVLR